MKHFLVGTVVLAVFTASAAAAQLRPLDPVEWRLWEDGRTVVASLGVGVFEGQRASLAGTEGRLTEAGNVMLAVRRAGVAIEAYGTVQRFFRDENVFAGQYGGVTESGPRRRDTGSWIISTVVRLTPSTSPTTAILRFGTRLPTTDNRVGLDRDQTDFFATVGGRVRHGGLVARAETGVEINGTREVDFEQSDLWAYLIQAEYRGGRVVPVATLTGHMDGLPNKTIRGNEDLSELRLGIRTEGRSWVAANLVKGFATFSPRVGLVVAVGRNW